MSHFLVASILGYEGGIGVRSGCFCAHPYVVHLLGLSQTDQSKWREQYLAGDRTDIPGMVRMSFGCYNNAGDVDRLVEMLHKIARADYKGDYRIEPRSGEYIPKGFREPLEDFFLLDEGADWGSMGDSFCGV